MSSTSGLKPLKIRGGSGSQGRVARVVRCSSSQENAAAKNVSSTIAAAALAAAVTFGAVGDAQADISGLTPCAESKAYKRRESKQVKSLTKRMAKAGLV